MSQIYQQAIVRWPDGTILKWVELGPPRLLRSVTHGMPNGRGTEPVYKTDRNQEIYAPPPVGFWGVPASLTELVAEFKITVQRGR